MPQSKTCSSWLPSCLNLWGSDSPKLASLRSEVLPYFGFFCLWSLIPRSLLRGVFISGLADRLGGVPLLYPHVSSTRPPSRHERWPGFIGWSQHEHCRRRNVLTGDNLKCKMHVHKGVALT
jgi:hypothetical protein